MIKLAAVITLLSLLCAVFAAVYTRRRAVQFTDEILDSIENCLRGERRTCAGETLQDKVDSALTGLYRSMESRQQAVDEERKNLQELISDISHQVKTPMTNLKMLNETMLEQAEGKQKEFLQAQEEQLKKLDFLIAAMVKTSRLETGLITLKKEEGLVSETLAAALGGIFLAAENKQLHVEVDSEEALTAAYDRKWTAEAVFNLLDNAVKYTPKGGRIRVSVKKQEAYLCIEVADDGLGIPESAHPKIWKRFYREESVHDIEGVGLGLYLVRQIVTLQGGYVKVSSRAGEGAVFSLYLPLR